MRVKVVDETLHEVAPGAPGELVMAGPQRSREYWCDGAATSRAHVSISGETDVYYRTGDRVRRDGDQPITYLGRIDHQIKILGHRVELGEVESVLRAEPGVDAAVAVGWPLTQTGPGGIAAFVTGSGLDPVAIRQRVRTKLQSHAVPQTIQVLTAFPQNASGKVDREALLRLLSA
jgi:acyl-coenzyme A synthetase/AMP-(fatty) acid ligase